jgi:hypothetical protein
MSSPAGKAGGSFGDAGRRLILHAKILDDWPGEIGTNPRVADKIMIT